MKKIFYLFSVLAIVLCFSGCKKEEEAKTLAEVTVMQGNTPKAGVTVYMFGSSKGPGTSFFSPTFANKTAVTESNGVATFELQEVHDLDVINTQTTLYFGVFTGSTPSGNAAITIKKGETKTATITL